jgi:ATP-dependent RNA/DNA helicase IGHMBP2
MVEETRTGLWGRQIMTLARASKGDGEDLPTHRFSPGDIVCIKVKLSQGSSSKEDSSARGIVYKVTNAKIQVALSSKPISVLARTAEVNTAKNQEAVENEAINMDYNGRIVTMVLMGNDTTFKRMEIGMKHLAKLHASNDVSSGLKVLFGIEKPDEVKIKAFLPLKRRYTSAEMNESQFEAISGAMAASQLFLIHGPPGTGKTTVLIEYILQAVLEQGKRLLVCAPSNVAVDNIVERLAPYVRGLSVPSSSNDVFSSSSSSAASSSSNSHLFKMVRIGHPARVSSNAALYYTVEEQYRQSNGYEVVKALEEDMDRIAKEISRTSSFAAKRPLKREWLDMKRDLKKTMSTAMSQVIQSANVVLATCTGADDRLLRFGNSFDVVVVDEAAQALDPIIMIPLLKSKKIVLAGDHLQLPPTIKSTIAIEKSLCTTTFFERAIRRFPSVSRLLSVQYRMNDIIMKYSSSALYRNRLTADESVKEHRLDDLVTKRSPTETSTPDPHKAQLLEDYLKNPLILVDTAGCSFDEVGGANESKWNEGEAKVVTALVLRLIEAGLTASDIGIISPYNAQVDLLRGKLKPLVGPQIEISSVDSFQGREKECIIYTLVRSNAHRNVGFLSSDQRTNVAITRAKRLLVIVGDTETCGSHKFLKKLFDFCESNGQYWSAAEFEQAYEAVDTSHEQKKAKAKAKKDQPAKKSSQQSIPAEPSKPVPNPASNSTSTTSKPASSADTFIAATRDDKPITIKPSAFDVLSEPAAETKVDTVVEEIEAVQISEPAVETPAASTDAKESTAPKATPPAKQTSSAKASASRLVTKPPQDYRDMQRAKYEAQKQTTVSSSSSSFSPYASTPKPASGSKEDRFGIPSSYFPQPSMHAPKKASAAKPKSSGAKASSSKPPPVAVKKSLLELDDDAFLDSLIAEKDKCYHKGCKTSTKVMSETCKYCKHIYCLSHFTPEIHGCGDDAKREGQAAARQKAVDLRLKASAGPPLIDNSKKLKDWQRSAVQEKLQKKLDGKKDDRSKKTPETKR